MILILNAVPEIKWEEDRVTIPEGGNCTVCFTSDIGTAAPYSVVVAVSPKLDNRPATKRKTKVRQRYNEI